MIQNEEKRLTLMVTGNEIQRKKNVKLDYQKCHLSKPAKLFWFIDQQLPFDQLQLSE